MARVYLTEKPAWNAALGRNEITVDEVTYPVLVDLTHPKCPAAAWLFNEGAGNVAHDIVAGNNGILQSTVSWDAYGTISDGSVGTGVIRYGTDACNVGDTSFTVRVRVKFDALDGRRQTIGKIMPGDPFRGWLLECNSGTTRIVLRPGSVTKSAYGTSVAVGQWLNVTAVVDRVAQTAVVYNDDTPGDPLVFTDTGTLSNAEPLRMFGGMYDDIFLMDGALGHASIHPTALTALQVASLNANPYQMLYYEVDDTPAVNIPAISRYYQRMRSH